MEAKNRTIVSAYQTNSQVTISNTQMNYKRMTDTASVANEGARVYGLMASSALSGINSMASASEQYNR